MSKLWKRKSASQKQTQIGQIYTVPVLMTCQCRSEKGSVSDSVTDVVMSSL
jgi:hypothetical protein